MAVRRRELLLENRELFSFHREADDVEVWIVEKETVASSTDCGQDLEHCNLIQHAFEEFAQDLLSSEERVESLLKLARQLINRHHGDQDAIEKRADEVAARWERVKQLTYGRRLVRFTFLTFYTE